MDESWTNRGRINHLLVKNQGLNTALNTTVDSESRRINITYFNPRDIHSRDLGPV